MARPRARAVRVPAPRWAGVAARAAASRPRAAPAVPVPGVLAACDQRATLALLGLGRASGALARARTALGGGRRPRSPVLVLGAVTVGTSGSSPSSCCSGRTLGGGGRVRAGERRLGVGLGLGSRTGSGSGRARARVRGRAPARVRARAPGRGGPGSGSGSGTTGAGSASGRRQRLGSGSDSARARWPGGRRRPQARPRPRTGRAGAAAWASERRRRRGRWRRS